MGMDWMKSGYGEMDKTVKEAPKTDYGKGNEFFWLSPEEESAFMVLEDEPASCFIHNCKGSDGKWGHREVCLRKNRISDNCPVCDNTDYYSKFVGFHTIIVLKPYVKPETGEEFCFQRRILELNYGGEDKPGTLRRFKRFAEEHDRLRGLVFKTYRSGKKTERVGDEFTVLHKVEPDKIEEWAKPKLEAYIEKKNALIERINAELLDEKKHRKFLTMENQLKYNPWEPYDFSEMEMFSPKSESALRGQYPPQRKGKSSSSKKSEGGGQKRSNPYLGGSDDGEDSDLPY